MTRLEDLRVIHRPEHDGATGFMRPAMVSDLVAALQAEGVLVIQRDSDGEWPIALRGLLGSWAHRWPSLSANTVLDTLYDHLAISSDSGGVVLPEEKS